MPTNELDVFGKDEIETITFDENERTFNPISQSVIHNYIGQEILLLLSNSLTNQDISKIVEGVNHFSVEQQGLSDMSAMSKVEYDDMLSRKQQNCVFVLKNSNGKLLGTMSIIPRTLHDKAGKKVIVLERGTALNYSTYQQNLQKANNSNHIGGLGFLFLKAFSKLNETYPMYSLTTSKGMIKTYTKLMNEGYDLKLIPISTLCEKFDGISDYLNITNDERLSGKSFLVCNQLFLDVLKNLGFEDWRGLS